MAGALQIVNTFKQGLTGSGTFDNFASGTGDIVTASDGSLIVPASAEAGRCWLEEIWAVDDSDALEISLSGPDFHDRELGFEAFAAYNVDGNGAARASLVSPGKLSNQLHGGNQFFVKGADQGSGNGNIVFLLRYTDLPGINAKLASAASVKAGAGRLVGVEVDLDASSAAQGDWSDDVALTANAGRRLDGDKFYAIVGFTGASPLAAVAVKSFETGQLRIGSPVVGESGHDAYSLLDIADKYTDSLIPVFRGYNQDNIVVACADPAAGQVAVVVEMVEVSQSVYDGASAFGG